ncbi:MAG: hypothetical protein R3C68_16065 [Myxococcota bacterium]
MATDKDNDPLVYRYRWFKNGTVQNWPLNKSEMTPGEGKKGETWTVEVTAFDGDDEGAKAARSLRFVNHPPGPPKVQLMPAAPRTTEDLYVRLSHRRRIQIKTH